jgi:lysylphosphatidylglycerol synthetase-like protein (DUF2156 family)
MNFGLLGKLFMGIGLGLLISGLAMDISVATGHGRVVNMGLASERLMLVLIGGFVFLGGIVLYAVHKATHTRGDEQRKPEVDGFKQGWQTGWIMELRQSVVENFAKNFAWVRLAHAMGIAFLVTTLVPIFSTLVGGLIYGFMVWLMFRQSDHRKAISQGWLLAAFALLCLVTLVLVQGFFYRDLDYLMPMNINEALIAAMPLIPAAVFYFVSRRYATGSQE